MYNFILTLAPFSKRAKLPRPHWPHWHRLTQREATHQLCPGYIFSLPAHKGRAGPFFTLLFFVFYFIVLLDMFLLYPLFPRGQSLEKLQGKGQASRRRCDHQSRTCRSRPEHHCPHNAHRRRKN